MRRKRVLAWFRLTPRERSRREHARVERQYQRAAAHAASLLLRGGVRSDGPYSIMVNTTEETRLMTTEEYEEWLGTHPGGR